MQNQLAVRSITSIDDVVVFERNNNNEIGKIIEGHSNDRVSVVTFKPLTPELLLQHSLPAVTVDDSPFAVKSGMVEVFQTETIMEIRRSYRFCIHSTTTRYRKWAVSSDWSPEYILYPLHVSTRR